MLRLTDIIMMLCGKWQHVMNPIRKKAASSFVIAKGFTAQGYITIDVDY
jgi:hypothetical protein